MLKETKESHKGPNGEATSEFRSSAELVRRRGPRRLKVMSRRNSSCGSQLLQMLDDRNWFTDSGYLHMSHLSDGTWHRVHCRHTDTPRLMCVDGELFWLVDA